MCYERSQFFVYNQSDTSTVRVAMTFFRERKDNVLSMAAERMEPEDSSSFTLICDQNATTSFPDHKLDERCSLESSVSSDEFYDAEEEPPILSKKDEQKSLHVREGIVDVPDYEDLVDSMVTGNRSIFRHLLSQIRIGMDLTKFTLPAFLMAPRSTLEMFASLFGRSHMLAEVTAKPTSQERMIAVVKWYLGSLSASRRDQALRKPYNPILGETFNCYWDLPGLTDEPLDMGSAKGGPFPEGGPQSFSFVAEQVSHHPPISAFYAECPAKKIFAWGTVCTKIRLSTSLAIKVQNTGKFRIRLLEHDEEYTTTMPQCYVRGILTAPWFEFGGECTLNCEKTGHSAKIIFHKKPFRGGKKHGITAELRHKSDTKPYMYFEGEWDKVLCTKEPDNESEPFLNGSLQPLTKKMKQLSTAESTDSRIVWEHLTEAILADNDQAAAEAKHQVEERQREKARERSKTGEVFEPKYFHQSEVDSTQWEYNHPLDKRLNLLS